MDGSVQSAQGTAASVMHVLLDRIDAKARRQREDVGRGKVHRYLVHMLQFAFPFAWASKNRQIKPFHANLESMPIMHLRATAYTYRASFVTLNLLP
jgi:DNA-binding GntR family transcriptional regulator